MIKRSFDIEDYNESAVLDDEDNEASERAVRIISRILRMLQLFCEGNNVKMKNFLRF